MQANLNLTTQVVAFGDPTANSNPSLKYVDWKRSVQGVSVANPRSESYTIAAGATLTIFDTTRATALDNTTSLDFVQKAPTTYRFTWNGAGTNPAFRTNRNLTTSGHTITFTVNTNQTANVASSTTGEWSAVQVGDIFFVPGVSTNDPAGPFNLMNEGAWTVLAKDGPGTNLTVARLPGSAFSALGEAQVPGSNGAVLAFSAAGVQLGDKVDVAAVYPASMQHTFPITNVTAAWFEVSWTAPLPTSVLAQLPGTAGMQFFSSAKRYGRVEADQSIAVQANGDAGQTQRLDPFSPGDPNQVGWWEKVGALWKLVLVNRGTVSTNVTSITAE